MATDFPFEADKDFEDETPATLAEWDAAYEDEDLYDEDGFEDIYDTAYERTIEAYWRE